tara:strand:- start:672 stop:1445 length:774 start_codon:yes stop_codon:yes gene_type:complete
MKIKFLFKNWIILFAISFYLVSCGSKKDVVYFQDASRFETVANKEIATSQYKVDDLINIHVSTLDPEASAPFNLMIGGLDGSTRPQQMSYLIDKDGEIDFPVIGKVKLAGLTQEEARVLLKGRLSDYLKDPIINIRLMNFTVTVLGEVNTPGTYPVNGEQITILEALGLANDLTIKGMRKNVLVIRDLGGLKVYTRIDLTTKEALKSPVYYLTQNDVVYVEPNNSAIASSSLDQRTSITISIISTLITTAVILITRL